AGGAALPHLRARHSDEDAVVGIDHDPRRQLGGSSSSGEHRRRQRQFKRESSAKRGRDFEKFAAGWTERVRHRSLRASGRVGEFCACSYTPAILPKAGSLGSLNSCRSLVFKSFPVAVCGSCSTKTTSSGIHHFATL